MSQNKTKKIPLYLTLIALFGVGLLFADWSGEAEINAASGVSETDAVYGKTQSCHEFRRGPVSR